MEKRDILNHLGEKIGELELPEGTPENVWQARLSAFAQPPAVAPIPDVTPRQFRQALILKGISKQNIEEVINSQPEPLRSLAMIEWEYSTVFKRDRPLINQMAPHLGFTSQDLDDLWRMAATL